MLATVRVLGAWLAEETSALREEIYDLIPFLVQVRYVEDIQFYTFPCASQKGVIACLPSHAFAHAIQEQCLFLFM